MQLIFVCLADCRSGGGTAVEMVQDSVQDQPPEPRLDVVRKLAARWRCG